VKIKKSKIEDSEWATSITNIQRSKKIQITLKILLLQK